MTPAFYHIGGDIFWRGAWMSDAQVQEHLDLALREHDACLRVGDRLSARVARSIFLELTDALEAQARWKRAAGHRPQQRNMPTKALERVLGA
jgi:hypothetical protein